MIKYVILFLACSFMVQSAIRADFMPRVPVIFSLMQRDTVTHSKPRYMPDIWTPLHHSEECIMCLYRQPLKSITQTLLRCGWMEGQVARRFTGSFKRLARISSRMACTTRSATSWQKTPTHGTRSQTSCSCNPPQASATPPTRTPATNTTTWTPPTTTSMLWSTFSRTTPSTLRTPSGLPENHTLASTSPTSQSESTPTTVKKTSPKSTSWAWWSATVWSTSTTDNSTETESNSWSTTISLTQSSSVTTTEPV